MVAAAGRQPRSDARGCGRSPPAIFYGIADAAIKAVATDWHAHGGAALWSGWTRAGGAGHVRRLPRLPDRRSRSGNAISSISLMNALAALVALACGLIAFGESLGTSPAGWSRHGLAIAVILGCVPVLAAAQMRLAEAVEQDGSVRAPRAPAVTGVTGAGISAQPAVNTSASSIGPSPGRRLNTHVAELQVARQRVGRLGGQQRSHQRHRPDQPRTPTPPSLPAQGHTGDQASQQPGHHHPHERLAVKAGQLQQRQRVADPRAGVEPSQLPQHVQPAVADQQAGSRPARRPERHRRTGRFA